MKKRSLGILLTILVMSFLMLPVVASADDVGEVTVDFTAGGFETANQIDYMNQKMAVKGDVAEAYGFTDNGDTSKVTLLDVLVQAHVSKYGGAFTKSTAPTYLAVGSGGYLSNAFKTGGATLGYYINQDMPTSYPAATEIKGGEDIDFFFYQDKTSWSDTYTYYEQKTVKAVEGKEISLTMMHVGYDATWNLVKKPVTADTVQIATVDAASGALTVIDGVTPGADGTVKLTFDAKGTYYVSAKGTIDGAAVTQPLCVVSVTAQTHSIQLDPAGGTWSDDGTTTARVISMEKGSTFLLPDAPTREGYTFAYWEGSAYNPGDSYTVQGDHTFTAKWTKNEAAAATGQGTSGTEGKQATTKGKSPATGEETNAGWMMILMLVAAGTMTFVRREN